MWGPKKVHKATSSQPPPPRAITDPHFPVSFFGPFYVRGLITLRISFQFSKSKQECEGWSYFSFTIFSIWVCLHAEGSCDKLTWLYEDIRMFVMAWKKHLFISRSLTATLHTCPTSAGKPSWNTLIITFERTIPKLNHVTECAVYVAIRAGTAGVCERGSANLIKVGIMRARRAAGVMLCSLTVAYHFTLISPVITQTHTHRRGVSSSIVLMNYWRLVVRLGATSAALRSFYLTPHYAVVLQE